MSNKLFHKDFTLVVIGQIISLFGNGIVRFALPLYLLNQTGSATLYGLVMALSFLPMIILTPIGGILADRVNKRNVMVILDFLTAALMLALFLLLGKVDLVLLLILTLMVLFAIQGAYQPTVQASIPLLASSENLLTANAVINQVNALAGLLAPILGGIVFGLWGLTRIILVGGICFFLSAVMELFIVLPYTKSQEKQGILEIVRQDFQDSFRFMRKDKPVIFKTIGIICGFNLFLSSMLIVSMPVLITQTLALSDTFFGFSQGAFAAGGLFGGIITGIFAKKLKVQNTYLLLVIISLLILPIAVVLLLGLPPFTCYLVICVSSFFMMSVSTMVTIQLLTFIQGETPSHLTGKVISCAMALAMCSQPLGQSLYGLLFDAFKSTPYLILFAAALLSGLISLLSKRVFRDMQMMNNSEVTVQNE